MPLMDSEDVTSVQLLLFFDYILQVSHVLLSQTCVKCSGKKLNIGIDYCCKGAEQSNIANFCMFFLYYCWYMHDLLHDGCKLFIFYATIALLQKYINKA
jgi:hypothetical protein